MAAVVIAIVLLQDVGSVGAVALKVLLGLAGLDLIVTAAMGRCPLYKALGLVPASMKGER